VMHSPMHDERNDHSALCVGMNLSGLLQRQEMLDSCTEKTVILTGIVGDFEVCPESSHVFLVRNHR
jgi:hypothetical protein